MTAGNNINVLVYKNVVLTMISKFITLTLSSLISQSIIRAGIRWMSILAEVSPDDMLFGEIFCFVYYACVLYIFSLH